MNRTQRKTRWMTRLLLGVALLVQGSLAAHACVTPVVSAGYALSTQSAEAAMPCHQAEKLNANLCLIHCTESDQVNLDQHIIAAVAVNEIVLHVAMPPLSYDVFDLVHSPLVLNTGPPLTIRFCSFLI